MKYTEWKPSRALDLAYRRQKTTRATLDAFEKARRQLLTELDPQQDEADIIEPLRRFLRSSGFGNYLNSRKKRDLVMHTGPDVADPIGILFELKHRKNRGEMVRLLPDGHFDLNRKALHELLLYYFQERTSEQQALELRQLIITSGYEWFIFDAHEFHRVFWKNTELRAFFQKHKQGQTTSGETKFFYDHAKELIEQSAAELHYTYVNLDLLDDKGQRRALGERGLLWQAKLFSAPHLLKEPFAQDANTLNRAFYEELLYLMGLEEVKDKNRKLIQRCAPERRERGSLLENTLVQLRAEDMLRNLPADERATYGDTPETQAEGVALALCLTWVSRLLFLKLLEGQLRRYHAPNDAPFRFLDPEQLKEYDQLNLLFYRVLNRPPQEREQPEANLYHQVPYLNSSLFEPAPLERVTLRISGLDDRIELPLLRRGRGRGGSVLHQAAGAPAPLALTYLLRFLDAYDFASEGEEAVQEGDDRPLISAAVLGLIFEKINGYRDGSFYTPGFITMYMCRHTLRRAVVRHFNERYAYQADSVPELRELLDDEPKQRPEFSRAFNELRVCDPAVGSGHFLVSALNELLAIKSELGLLLDDEGKRLRYTLTVARDELAVVSDEDDTLFEYRATLAPDGTRRVGREHTRLQSALFREKRHLIEHCLYGVDLNPNSVRICRLRLWIELLKHAYYTPTSQYQELETLPNLDLNVRAGNSLISRYALGADLTSVFRRKDTSVAEYRRAFGQFFSARGREAKQELQDFLTRLKEQFRVAVSIHDPLQKKLKDLRGQLAQLEYSGLDLFGKKARSEQDRAVEQQRLQMLIDITQEQLTEKREATLYRDAFEWRFEFPEILNHDGSFRGFDVVIGNPPYGLGKQNLILQFMSTRGNSDLYAAFIEQSLRIVAPAGEVSLIIPVSWLSGERYSHARRYIKENAVFTEGVILPYGVFTEAFVDTGIFSFTKKQSTEYQSKVFQFPPKSFISSSLLDNIQYKTLNSNQWTEKQDLSITFDDSIERLKSALNNVSIPLSSISISARGILADTGDVFDSEQINTEQLFTGTVKRYSTQENYQWVVYGDNLKEKPSSKDVFNGPRILVRRLISRQFRVQATLTEKDFINKKDIYSLKITDKAYTPKYVLAFINSTIISKIITGSSTIATKNDFSQLGLNELRSIPIPPATPAQQAAVAALVEQVLAAKAADAAADTTALEQQIDALVAALYGLTAEEVALLGG